MSLQLGKTALSASRCEVAERAATSHDTKG